MTMSLFGMLIIISSDYIIRFWMPPFIVFFVFTEKYIFVDNRKRKIMIWLFGFLTSLLGGWNESYIPFHFKFSKQNKIVIWFYIIESFLVNYSLKPHGNHVVTLTLMELTLTTLHMTFDYYIFLSLPMTHHSYERHSNYMVTSILIKITICNFLP